MSRTITFAVLIFLILCTVPSAVATEFYQWTDENGVTHFATSLDDVPEKYRDQFKTHSFEDSPEPESSGETIEQPTEADEAPSLKNFEVPYEPYEGSARRVIIDVKFNDRVTAPMALDTGSPGMVISPELAERLDLFSGSSATLFTAAGGIGGVQLAILTIVDSVSVGEARDVFVPTKVTYRISEAFEGLIGMDFLTNYKISIDTKNHVVVFEETPADPNSRGGHDEEWWRNIFKEFRAERDFWQELAEGVDKSRAASAKVAAYEFQAREAERLLQRLDLYASDNAVPRHWR